MITDITESKYFIIICCLLILYIISIFFRLNYSFKNRVYFVSLFFLVLFLKFPFIDTGSGLFSGEFNGFQIIVLSIVFIVTTFASSHLLFGIINLCGALNFVFIAIWPYLFNEDFNNSNLIFYFSWLATSIISMSFSAYFSEKILLGYYFGLLATFLPILFITFKLFLKKTKKIEPINRP